MILKEQQIKNIILQNPNKALVSKGQEYSKIMRLHIYGERIESELETIAEFEKPTLRSLRVKYTKSNKDLFARLLRPLDKIFSAKGGSVYYNLSSKEQDQKAREMAADIRNGYSIKAWIEHFWKPHFLDDPNGFIFIEMMPMEEAKRNKAMGKNYIYPTYKSIDSVYDYMPAGSSLEYVVFNVSAAEKKLYGLKEESKIYRVVDDSMDYFVQLDGEQVTILKDYSFPNYFMKVPGILNSDIPNPNHSGNMLSMLDELLELAKSFLLKGSIKVTHDFLHGFPKYWQYADNCPKCQGTGLYEAADCKECSGTGRKLMTKVSDAMLLTHPETTSDATIAPNVAGYVSPDKTYWEIATADLKMLEDVMTYTLWGTSSASKTEGLSMGADGGGKTATEIVSNLVPQADRLHPVTESAELRHKFILDALIKIQVNKNYQGATVNYGKRYMFESADVLWEKYAKARTAGAAASVLDDLLMEYYEAKYDSDPVKLAIQTKLMKVEPFVHMTTLQLKALSPAEEDYKAKLYFSEWLSTMNDSKILFYSEDELKTQLSEAVAKKKLIQPENQAVLV